MRREQKKYLTSLDLATFLLAKGETALGTRLTGRGDEREFVFLETPRLEELEDKYKWGDREDSDLLVQVHLYEQARRQLIDRLKEKIETIDIDEDER